MQYTIKNTHLTLTVDTLGAQMVSVKNEAGEELLWQADKSVWGYSAPMLFPWVGRMKEGKFFADGQEFAAANHGFIRNVEHSVVLKEDNLIIFEFKANAETKKKYPYNFVFRTSYILSGHSIHHKIDVSNTDNKNIGFGLGYHPAFNLPFDNKHKTEDYYLEFDTPQSPKVLAFSDRFLIDGSSYTYGENITKIPLKDNFFENDSLIFSELTAKTVSIVEKDTGKRIEFDVQDFPYVTLWTAATPVTKFFCIEPWLSTPDREDAPLHWEKKEHSINLKPGEAYHILSRIRITR